jgi:hypothetical protein
MDEDGKDTSTIYGVSRNTSFCKNATNPEKYFIAGRRLVYKERDEIIGNNTLPVKSEARVCICDL